ncbi:N-6 DNA methylase [Olsenella sp. Marseille-P4559]|uniref:N-6 DNA methylase n=1 Tax=Olsenella sp. Marseille-P4559 TaxID=2364795 RepID=UPI0013EEF15F|nr:N-6 DNA methylase [Olsenella sp. Marseille-P4559]
MSLTPEQTSRIMIAKDLDHIEPLGDMGVDANLAAYAALLLIEKGLDRHGIDHEQYLSVVGDHQLDPILRDRFVTGPDGAFESAALHLFGSPYTTDELRDFVLHYNVDEDRSFGMRRELTTPEPLRALALAILDCHDGDRLYDACCGAGSLLVDAIERNPGIRTYGVDVSQDAACLAVARMRLLPGDRPVGLGDVFHRPSLVAYDKVFANPPFGMKLAFMRNPGADYLAPFVDETDPMGRPASADWVFARLAYDSLAEGGTAVAIVTNGALGNGGDQRARRYFVENGMLRAVVALPTRLFRSTALGCALLVLGRNDGPVRMVDASDLADEGRRWNTLSDEAVSEIVGRLGEDGPMSRRAERADIASRGYSLYASRYLGQAPDLVNPRPLGDLSLAIERGAGFSARELDALTTEEDTGLFYVRLSDIEDGAISDDLPNLTSLDQKTERQWLRTGDLVISKNGAPFKVAVADVPEGRTILANGNLYVIRLDTDRVDPYFVAAFLASEDGKRSLEQMVVGTTIPNLPLRNLRQIQIPVPPADVQKKAADGYRARLDEISVLKIRIRKSREAAAGAYDEAVGR